MRIDKGDRNTSPAPVPLFPIQIPHDLSWGRTHTALVGSRLNNITYRRTFPRHPLRLSTTMFFIPPILHKRYFSVLHLPVKQGSTLELEHALLRQSPQNVFGHESWNNELREKLILFVFYVFLKWTVFMMACVQRDFNAPEVIH